MSTNHYLKTKTRKSGRVSTTGGTHRRFSESHPFWEEAIQLRQEYYSYQYIVDRAHTLGYDDLSIQTLRAGLAYAPAVLLLPAHGGHYLQRRYASVTEDFDVADTLKYFIADVIGELQDVDEALTESDLIDEQRASLLMRRDEIRALGYQWTKEFFDFQVRIEGIKAAHNQFDDERRKISLPQYLDSIVTEFRQYVTPPSPDTVIEQYGSQNIRFPDAILPAAEGDAEED